MLFSEKVVRIKVCMVCVATVSAHHVFMRRYVFVEGISLFADICNHITRFYLS